MNTVRVTIEQRGGAAHTKRALDRAVRTALQATIDYWHETYLPGHFTVAGGRKYEYQPRSGDDEPPRIPVVITKPGGGSYTSLRSNPHYSWRKRREKRHNKPLVWSGNSEAAAKLSIRLSTRRLAAEDLTRGTGVLDLLPDYFYQYRKDHNGGRPINKSDELTRVTPDEQDDLHRQFERSMSIGLGVAATPPAVTLVS